MVGHRWRLTGGRRRGSRPYGGGGGEVGVRPKSEATRARVWQKPRIARARVLGKPRVARVYRKSSVAMGGGVAKTRVRVLGDAILHGSRVRVFEGCGSERGEIFLPLRRFWL